MSFAGPAPSSSRGIFSELVRLQQAGRRAVLATPLWARGSVPLSHQSKLLYRDDGSIRGTVGGGLLEARVVELAREAIGEDTPRVIEFQLEEDQAARSGMICGGRCSVLLEPVSPQYSADAFAAAARAEEEGEPVVLVTILEPEERARKLAYTAQGEPLGPVDEAGEHQALAALARECCEAARPRFVEEPVPAHFDPILPLPTVIIFGGGHIAVPLAHLADLIGFRVVVVDDREEFANRQRFPQADQVVAAPVSDAYRQLRVGDDSYVIAVTRGHALDEDVVAEALRTPARYIGMIGSERKVEGVVGRLRERGFGDEDLARVHAPIGLDIGADTVEEIAVSIVAQLVAVRRRAS
jgi:xanthine dehydrogenase accessory factor